MTTQTSKSVIFLPNFVPKFHPSIFFWMHESYTRGVRDFGFVSLLRRLDSINCVEGRNDSITRVLSTFTTKTCGFDNKFMAMIVTEHATTYEHWLTWESFSHTNTKHWLHLDFQEMPKPRKMCSHFECPHFISFSFSFLTLWSSSSVCVFFQFVLSPIFAPRALQFWVLNKHVTWIESWGIQKK